jgi:uncharacterized protein
MEYFKLKAKIKDKKGNKYIYFPKWNLLFPEELVNSNNCFSKKIINFLKKIKSYKDNKGLSIREVRRKIANVRRLVLNISEDCNSRCRYCVYSGKFFDRRRHTKRLMSWRLAKDSIDFFFDLITKNKNIKYHPYSFIIGFYGGEPLLNFRVIKKSVFYTKSIIEENEELKRAKLTFNMTTNGLLLDEEKFNFLKENDFGILISLDGPPEIHDKNRGKGNFKRLFEKILYIYTKYPEYYKSKVSFAIVYAKDTDLKKVRDFFSQSMFEECSRLEAGYVVDDYSYLKFPKHGVNEKLVIEKIKEKKEEGMNLTRIEEQILNLYYSDINLDTLTIREGNYGGFCTLGTKELFVSLDGELYGCEKTRASFKIGNLKNGFDFKRIAEIEKEWKKNTTKCENCLVQSFCTACVAKVGVYGKIEMNNYCMKPIEDFKEKVSEYIEFKKI